MYTKENFYEMDKTDLRAVNGGAGDRFLDLGNLPMPYAGKGPAMIVPFYGIPACLPKTAYKLRPPVYFVPVYGIPPFGIPPSLK